MKKIAVVCGGWSNERVISLASGKAMQAAAVEAGYDVHLLDATRDLYNQLTDLAPDAILNALHGTWGEDGHAQGIFETLQIPYSHSGVMASALAMDKIRAKRILAMAGLDVAKDVTLNAATITNDAPLDRPFVVKPISDGSSFGVVKIGENMPLQPYIDEVTNNPTRAYMAEEFIAGQELTVAVMGDRPLCVTEIFTGRDFYDFKAKYDTGGSTHTLPADIPNALTQRAMDQSLEAHKALGCRGVSRSDFRYDPSTDRLIILEVNTQPGMTATSLVPEQAAHVGISFPELIAWMVEDSSCHR